MQNPIAESARAALAQYADYREKQLLAAGDIESCFVSVISRLQRFSNRFLWYGKSNCRRMRFGDFCRSFLPERIFQIAARRSVNGTSQGETRSGAVIAGDMILMSKHVGSQRRCDVLCGRNDLPERAPSTCTARRVQQAAVATELRVRSQTGWKPVFAQR